MTTSTEVLEVAASIEEMLPAVAAVLREYADLLKGGGIVDKKPVEAIERMRRWVSRPSIINVDDELAVLAYLDSIPEGSVPVVWPKELTRERLEEIRKELYGHNNGPAVEALRALAAIAPERKKRVVNLWLTAGGGQVWMDSDWTPDVGNYRCVARNVELED